MTQLYITGYTVDEKGNIQFPLLGDVFVRNKTIPEISAILSEKIEKYVSNALVKVKLVSFKVTVLGEVRNPGVVYIYNDRASILEVLGYTGDLTDLANRHKVKLIRTVNDKVLVSNLDLTDRALVEGNSFFLLPNDVLYIEPTKAKNFRLNLPAISLFISSLTTILVIINLVTN
jgi:polysaccharide export outer membrane protein